MGETLKPLECLDKSPTTFGFGPVAYSYHFYEYKVFYILLPLMIWTYLNPRFFKKPKTTKSWASKAVLGERVLTQKDDLRVIIPKHHAFTSKLLTYIASAFGLIMVYGIVSASFWFCVIGTVGSYMAKMWFLDRMVWLFEDIRQENSTVSSWLY